MGDTHIIAPLWWPTTAFTNLYLFALFKLHISLGLDFQAHPSSIHYAWWLIMYFSPVYLLWVICWTKIYLNMLSRIIRFYTETVNRGGLLVILFFFFWFLRAVYQSVIVFVSTIHIYWWLEADYNSLSLVPFTVAIIIQSLTIVIESHYFTWVNQVLVWGTLASYFLMMVIATSIIQLDMYGAMFHFFSTGMFWVAILFLSIVALCPVISWKYFFYHYRPTAAQLISYLCHLSVNFSVASEATTQPPIQSKRASIFDNTDAQLLVQMIRFEAPPREPTNDVTTPLLKNEQKHIQVIWCGDKPKWGIVFIMYTMPNEEEIHMGVIHDLVLAIPYIIFLWCGLAPHTTVTIHCFGILQCFIACFPYLKSWRWSFLCVLYLF